MGCDIHLAVEGRSKANGEWISLDDWCVGDEEDPEYRSLFHGGEDRSFYGGRNYGLFAILADVRNNHDYVPIAMPRGVPQDASEEFTDWVSQWGVDGHSHSWLTLQELLQYDWTQEVEYSGMVGPVDWAKWHYDRRPSEWSGGVGGGNVRIKSPDDFLRAWETVRQERGYPEGRWPWVHLRGSGSEEDREDHRRFCEILGGSPYCKVRWTVPYHECTSEFWAHTIPRLLRLGSPEDVRIVFFFDN